ncbi:MAG: aspartate kinase [bacterium]|nr:aspartate kinase [bacterium]
MGEVVCKFGGTSLADAGQLQKVARIIDQNAQRRFIVPSAPGKRTSDDTKVTDLLYLCHEMARQKMDFREPFENIRTRYGNLVQELGVDMKIGDLLDEVQERISLGASQDYVASRGEFLCGKLLSALLEATFVDPVEAIRFRSDGRLDPVSYTLLEERLSGPGQFVIPGFYGATPDGEIKTFSRGGSDITGAIVARAVRAAVYENWTDVSGMLMADPRMVPNAMPVEEITYREMRELAYMGAAVFHDEAMFPAMEADIPIHIKNTNRPEDPGTRIVPRRDLNDKQWIVGVAGRPDFTMVYIEKALMNQERGFGRKVLEIVESHGISYEHTPSGIDTMSVIISDEELDGKGDLLLEDMKRILEPDRVELYPGLALTATVGEGMSHRIGVAAQVFSALAEAGVNVRVIDQGASEINIIVGVEEADLQPALQAIYQAFVP